MGSKELELVLLTSFEPSCFGTRGGFRQARDQSDRSGNRVVTLATHLTKIRQLPIDQTLAIRLGAIEQTDDPRGSEQRVMLGFERRELLTSDVCTATRHHDRGIPAEERKRPAERMKAFELLFELLIR
jgi:hypothetical protein